jgi:hypothetical protein
MKALKKLIIPSTILILIALALLYVFPGCEKDGDTSIPGIGGVTSPDMSGENQDQVNSLTISPSAAQSPAFVGQQFLYTVSDGTAPYTWTVSSPSFGTITPNSDTANAIYTVLAIEPNSILVTDTQGHSAVGLMETSTVSAATLTINPPGPLTYSLSALPAPIHFSVSGGAPPYSTWNDSNPASGTLGDTVTPNLVNVTFYFQNNGSTNPPSVGATIISISDGAANTAQATITITP